MLWMLIACGGSSGSDSAEAADEPLDCTETTSWASVGAPFVYTWCTPCHSPTLSGDDRQGAPDGVDFGSYEDVLTYADRIEDRIFNEAAPMPPAGGPTEAELAAMATWLECGLPE